MPRREFDGSLRALAGDYAVDFLAWLVSEDALLERSLDTVLVVQERRTDLLLQYSQPPDSQGILHLEFQRVVEKESDIPFRMAEYALRIRSKYGQIPKQFLILIENSPLAREVPSVFIESTARVEYQVLRLWELDATEVLNLRRPGLVPLIPLMGTVEQLGERLNSCSELLDSEVESTQERQDLLTLAIFFGALQPRSVAVIESFLRSRQMLNLLEESWLAKELVAKAEAKGEAKGEARGKAEGQVEGEARATRNNLIRLLTRKFGVLPAALTDNLTGITELSSLERLMDIAIDANSLEGFLSQM
jgi:predicted transposase YdaD